MKYIIPFITCFLMLVACTKESDYSAPERYIRPGKMLSGRQKSAEQVPTGGISPSIWNMIKKN